MSDARENVIINNIIPLRFNIKRKIIFALINFFNVPEKPFRSDLVSLSDLYSEKSL